MDVSIMAEERRLEGSQPLQSGTSFAGAWEL